MAFCPNCGNPVNDDACFCASCGTNLKSGNEQPTNIEEVKPEVPQPKKREFNMTQLVWAIINIVLCCLPLGVVALITTIIAKDAPNDETEAKNLKTAKICNIIATVAGAVSFVIGFIIGLLSAL